MLYSPFYYFQFAEPTIPYTSLDEIQNTIIPINMNAATDSNGLSKHKDPVSMNTGAQENICGYVTHKQLSEFGHRQQWNSSDCWDSDLSCVPRTYMNINVVFSGLWWQESGFYLAIEKHTVHYPEMSRLIITEHAQPILEYFLFIDFKTHRSFVECSECHFTHIISLCCIHCLIITWFGGWWVGFIVWLFKLRKCLN